MALEIRTTGLDEYAPGGPGTLKVLLIGGQGAGKTRWSSYWPKPIYLDCEGGLASVADRKVPYVRIKNSKDMLDALVFLKQDNARPVAERKFRTAIVDTADAYQRKVKDEWLQRNPNAQAFSGFEAWGFLDSKMQMLLTRLLNLDMNVIVCVHYTDKTITEGEGANQQTRQEYQLQLSGAIKDQIFNDFDLVGWMGTYYAAEDGQRKEKRGLTFTRTPEKPFLKDRLNVTPKWMQVEFSDDDYAKLFEAAISRLDDLPDSALVGEIPDSEEIPIPMNAGVVAPGAQTSGALPAQPPREIPLHQHDKATLAKKCREAGITTTVEGAPFKGNTTKAEYLAALDAHSGPATPAAPPAVPPAVVPPATPVADAAPSHDEAVKNVESGLGGKVISDEKTGEQINTETGEVTPAAPAAAPKPTAGGSAVCADCGASLSGQKFARVSKVRFGRYLCDTDFATAKANDSK